MKICKNIIAFSLLSLFLIPSLFVSSAFSQSRDPFWGGFDRGWRMGMDARELEMQQMRLELERQRLELERQKFDTEREQMKRNQPLQLQSDSSQGLVLGNKIELHRIGTYTIRVTDGYYQNKPCIIFAAHDYHYDMQCWNAYMKNNKDDVKKIDDYNKMDELGKKRFIKESFLKQGLDLGPIE